MLYILSSFDHSTYIELALAMMEENGIKREKILAVPIDRRKPKARLFDTIHSSDGVSFLDLGMALATAFAVIGAIYGFILPGGPIIWGLIGAGSGMIIGAGLNLIMYRRKHGKEKRIGRKATEVIVIVECKQDQENMVEGILWDYMALGVGKLHKEEGDQKHKANLDRRP